MSPRAWHDAFVIVVSPNNGFRKEKSRSVFLCSLLKCKPEFNVIEKTSKELGVLKCEPEKKLRCVKASVFLNPLVGDTLCSL